MPFDLESAQKARQQNPDLTPYDTGEMLEPRLYVEAPAVHSQTDVGRYGRVDFDNDEGRTVLAVFAHPGALSTDNDQTTVLTIEWDGPGTLRVNLNDSTMFQANSERVTCSQCDEEIADDDVHSGLGMCGICLHNAVRSGWEPGSGQ